MSDEEPVDPKKLLEDRCKPKCVKQLRAYEYTCLDYYRTGFWEMNKHEFRDASVCLVFLACVRRISGDETGTKHCTGQYFDYWHCVDRCVAPDLFRKLK